MRARACDPIAENWLCSATTANDGLRYRSVDFADEVWVRFVKTSKPMDRGGQISPGRAASGMKFTAVDRLRPAVGGKMKRHSTSSSVADPAYGTSGIAVRQAAGEGGEQ